MKQTLLSLAALLAFSFVAQAQDLLKNGDFESGGDNDIPQWSKIWPSTVFKKSPEFGHPKGKTHKGKRCASIATTETGGYSSYTQEVSGFKDHKLLRLEGWIRFEPSSGAEGAASLMLLFYDPGKPNANYGILESTRVSQKGDWTRVEIEAPVPPEAKALMIRCGIRGIGTAFFDDVTLLPAKPGERERAHVSLAVGHTAHYLEGKDGVTDPWIEFAIPFPFEGQTPLSIRLTSEPPDFVTGMTIRPDRENRLLRARLKPIPEGTRVTVRAETPVLLRDRSVPDGAGIPLPRPASVPDAVKTFLDPAPGLDPDDAAIRKAAASFSSKDLASYAADLLRFLKDKLKPDAGGNQGAKESLERGSGVCTGNANLAASLFLANGIPARVLACTLSQGKLQEHYIVEIWTPQTAWTRVEPSMKLFPVKDSQHLVLRVIYPDSVRSGGNVPLYFAVPEGMQGGFAMDKEGCWQSAEIIQSAYLDPEGVEALELAARKGFLELEKSGMEGAGIRLIPSLDKLSAIKKLDRAFVQEIEKRLPR